jgi:hypothetical protein
MNVYLIALIPLLLALNVLVVVLPIALHYANKEHSERKADRAASIV